MNERRAKEIIANHDSNECDCAGDTEHEYDPEYTHAQGFLEGLEMGLRAAAAK